MNAFINKDTLRTLDQTTLLVFCDWLDEQSDPRGKRLRRRMEQFVKWNVVRQLIKDNPRGRVASQRRYKLGCAEHRFRNWLVSEFLSLEPQPPEDVPDWLVCPDCGPVVVEPDAFYCGEAVSGECPECQERLYFQSPDEVDYEEWRPHL